MSLAVKLAVKVSTYPQNVKRRVKDHQKRVLYAQGKYLRTTEQRSMRYPGKKKIGQASRPGKPPNAHKTGSAGPLLRKLIRFFVDLAAGSVICGPQLFAGSKSKSSKPLPQLLDEGGQTQILDFGKPLTVHIRPRPFTKPLFTDGGKNFDALIAKEKM